MFVIKAKSGMHGCIGGSTDPSRYGVWHNNEDSTWPHCPCCVGSGKSTESFSNVSNLPELR